MTTRQAVVVSRKMDTPTAVVAMLGIESFALSEFMLGLSEDEKEECRNVETCDEHLSLCFDIE